jgi:hypothetical protein
VNAIAMSEEEEEKSYWYGITLTKKGFRPLIYRQKSKAPKGIELKEAPDLITAQIEADRACREAFGTNRNQESPDEEVVAGSVARYIDGDSEHWSIVLKVNPNGDAVCLFFSSKPEWSKSYRKATKEEIALAGFIFSKSTYLASAVRPINCFISTGLKFPLDRCEELYAEFFKKARDSKRSKL